MASILPHKRGWRAQVYVGGVRGSASFRTKREAEAWASQRETALREQAEASPGDRTTLGDVLDRYAAEVSPSKRGARWEILRLGLMKRDPTLPVTTPVASVTPEHIAAWRTHRLGQVAASSVLRELGLLSSVMEHARREWRLLPSNPVRDVRRPRAPDHRNVLISLSQTRAMCRALGYRSDGRITEVRQAVAVAFLLALRTGMRAGELCGLTWDRVKGNYCILAVTKTKPRNVPLVHQARRLIERMRGWDEKMVLGLHPASLDAMFRKYRQRAGLEGFTFHDSRHTAATRIAQKIDVLTLCKIFGWANTSQALTYFNQTASQIADRLGR